MAGRGPQTFNKRKKEQERKERQQAKMEKRLQRRNEHRDQPGPEMGEPVAPFGPAGADGPADRTHIPQP